MKIIVDKMPKNPKECIFSECMDIQYSNYICKMHICKLHQGKGCDPDKCNFLKPLNSNIKR